MIYCTNTVYAKVWKILKTEQKYMDLRISTSEKDGDGKYIDSSWFPRVIGHAFNSLKDSLKEGDRIVITKMIISNPPYKAQDGSTKSSIKVRILEAKINEDTPNQNKQDENTTTTPTPEADTNSKEDCPW